MEEQAACRFTTDESVITKWQNTDIKLTCRIYCGYRKKPARPETHSLLSLQERCVNKMACTRCYNELHYILLLLSSFSLCVYLKSIVLTRLHTHTHTGHNIEKRNTEAVIDCITAFLSVLCIVLVN